MSSLSFILGCFSLLQGSGVGAEDHQERGQVPRGGQARGERAGEAPGGRPDGQTVSVLGGAWMRGDSLSLGGGRVEVSSFPATSLRI